MISEVDYNHPDHPSKQNIVELSSDTEAIYIYVPNAHNMPPTKFQKQLDNTLERFKEALPNIIILVGAHDLKFTTISRKQVFKGKLDGQIRS